MQEQRTTRLNKGRKSYYLVSTLDFGGLYEKKIACNDHELTKVQLFTSTRCNSQE